MPFVKITKGKGRGKYRSPSGRLFNRKQVQRYYARGGSFDAQPALICDAPGKTGDPTGTIDIRRRYMSMVEARWRRVRMTLQQALGAQDMLGLNPQTISALALSASLRTASGTPQGSFSALPDDNKVRALQSWAESLITGIVLEGEGEWLRPMIAASYARAITRAMRLSHSPAVPHDQSQTIGALLALSVAELQGICQATLQRVVREASLAILHHDKPAELARAVAVQIQTIGVTRSRAMIALMVVKAHSIATLDQFQAAGIQRVGLIPELIPARRLQDAPPAFTGPGSRIGRQSPPSLRTVQRIRAAQRAVEGLGLVNVETAGDFLVCPICEGIEEDNPYSINEARALIPAHPNCRCAFIPVFDTLEDMNPYHKPPGSPEGGEFTSGPDAGVESIGDPTSMVVPADKDYAYHATNVYGLVGIAEDGRLKAFGPSHGTEQSSWPDGSTERRSYWSSDPLVTRSFHPEEGRPALIRAKKSALAFKTESTGDLYVKGSVKSHHLEYLSTKGDWLPVSGLKLKHDANPYHEPAGSPEGGQFASHPGNSVEPDKVMGHLESHLARAGNEVDGLIVRSDVPNTASIGAEFNSEDEYTELRGIRAVPFSDFEAAGRPARNDRTEALAKQILQTGEINPLIVVYEQHNMKAGPYILEGGHRFDALQIAGKKKFPALVIVDHRK